jgi:hypothetical protein
MIKDPQRLNLERVQEENIWSPAVVSASVTGLTLASHAAIGDGTPHHAAITLAGAPDYLTLAGQVLTLEQIDLTADITGILPFANFPENMELADGKYVGVPADVRTVYDSTNGDIIHQLSDAAGADEVQVKDSGAVVVSSVDSDGNAYFAGNVGIGIATPAADVEMAKSADNAEHRISTYSTTDNQGSVIRFQKSASATIGTLSETADGERLGSFYFAGVDTGGNSEIACYIRGVQDGAAGTRVPGELQFWTATDSTTSPTQKIVVKKSGDVGIGATANPTANGGKVLFFGDNTADPTMASNTAGFYGKDVSGTVEAFAVDEAGNAAQLTPHNYAGPVQPLTGVLHWSQYHRNEFAGVEKWYDMERALLALEELTGETFIHTQAITKKNWHANQAKQGTRKAKPKHLRSF